MPHCIIEYSGNLDSSLQAGELVKAVNDGVIQSGLFKEKTIKTRAKAYTSYSVGGELKDFVHVDIHIFSGRSPEKRRALSSTVLDKLEAAIPDVDDITVNIIEDDKQAYAKRGGL